MGALSRMMFTLTDGRKVDQHGVEFTPVEAEAWVRVHSPPPSEPPGVGVTLCAPPQRPGWFWCRRHNQCQWHAVYVGIRGSVEFEWAGPVVAAIAKSVDWEAGGRIHNWRNHVDPCVREIWHTFTDAQIEALKQQAEAHAGREEWD